MNATPSSTDQKDRRDCTPTSDRTDRTDRTGRTDRSDRTDRDSRSGRDDRNTAGGPAGRTVHLDTAGWGRMPAAVRALVADCAAREDRYGPHELEEHLEHVLRTEIHDRLGALLGVPAADTAVVTDAATAFDALVRHFGPGRGDRIWTTPYEGVANLTALYALRDRTRCRLEVVPLREDGDLDLEWMARHIDDDVALVSVVHVPSGRGIVNPVETIGRILAPHRCLYAVDASYAAGQLPVDAARIGCHLLTGDGWRFLRGPHDVGFAYLAPRLRDTFEEAAAHRAPPQNAAVAGLNAALAHHAATLTGPAGHDGLRLLPALRAAVEETPGAELITPGLVQSGILAFRHRELPAALVRRQLAARGVVLWKTVAQEIPLLDHPAGTALRASLHHGSTPDDITRFGHALQAVVREERPQPAGPHPAARRTAPAAAAPAATPGPRPPTRRHLTLCPSP
ncbi:aminotransferase class V-fold PLP-dependent enzyme [Streptomyces sp. NPDC087843]|uniref:aminotransferase class V-fold PLP-dependent enzyme n=1 Tax=Streptomyces sp. NPDC087843 TaxID=3365804 RepID=UPI003815446E